MKRNNKNFKSGMSLAVMLGSMAIIASVFGYFVSSWFLDYVTAPQEGIESVYNEQIITEERVTASEKEKEEKTEDESEEIDEAQDTISSPIGNDGLFVVQVGAFDKEENARGLVDKLQSIGFTAYITSENPYRVQVGAFRTKDAAEDLGGELEKQGFPVYIGR